MAKQHISSFLSMIILFVSFLFYAVSPVQTQDSEIAITAMAWHPDGSMLAVATTEGIWLYTPNGEVITQLTIDVELEPIVFIYLAWHPTENQLAAGILSQVEDRIYIWTITGNPPNIDITTEQVIDTILGTAGLTWSPNTRLASAFGSGDINIWDVTTGNLEETLSPPELANIDGIDWSGSGLAMGLSRDEITILDTKTLRVQTRLEGVSSSGLTNAVAWNSTGDQLAVSEYSDIVIWEYDSNTESYHVLTTLTQSPELIWRLDWQADRLAASAWNQTIQVWDTTTWEVIDTFQLSNAPKSIKAFALSPDGSQLAYSGLENTLEIIDIEPEP